MPLWGCSVFRVDLSGNSVPRRHVISDSHSKIAGQFSYSYHTISYAFNALPSIVKYIESRNVLSRQYDRGQAFGSLGQTQHHNDDNDAAQGIGMRQGTRIGKPLLADAPAHPAVTPGGRNQEQEKRPPGHEHGQALQCLIERRPDDVQASRHP
jgi:hypothetical protein